MTFLRYVEREVAVVLVEARLPLPGPGMLHTRGVRAARRVEREEGLGGEEG